VVLKGFLIAGTASGVGKTTVSLAILAEMRRRGLRVQPFKGGPDFLDTGHHTRISGRVARNLDTWMMSAEANVDVAREASQDADVILVEGMMGLFDGKSGASEIGSSAEIAKLLRLPVVLVLDASKSARSLAAVVLGFELYDRDISIAGIVLNRVASERHFLLLQTAILASCRSPIFGWLPNDVELSIPERHLGLATAEETILDNTALRQVDAFADVAGKHLDVERLSLLECGLDLHLSHRLPNYRAGDPVRIGVARDQAFSFYYEDNLDLLRRAGADIVFFSPINDSVLPRNLDALYLGGGYPELYAEKLSANKSMLMSLRDFVSRRGLVYAECGGLILLAKQITTNDSANYGMSGILPFQIEMTDKLVQFGYVTVELIDDSLLGPAGMVIRGHSFHYSRMRSCVRVPTSYSVHYSLTGKQEDEGYRIANVLASYIHLHFRAVPSIAASFVQAARTRRALIASGGHNSIPEPLFLSGSQT
jgi:cobyrinic acid a,c-diamide synthase